MKAMVLEKPGQPLVLVERPDPLPGPGQIRLKVEACAVCRTDLHVVDGELERPKLPLVPGHEIVGVIDAVGTGVDPSRTGRRVGVPWLGHTCGACDYCRSGAENLCDAPLLPATRAMAGSPPMSSQMPILLSISMRPPILWLWRPCSALG